MRCAAGIASRRRPTRCAARRAADAGRRVARARARARPAGAVISASHNPFPDNGIKLFGADGFKLADDEEDRVEALMGEPSAAADRGRRRAGRAPLAGAAERYAHLGRRRAGTRSTCPALRVVVDCANGAAADGRAASSSARLGVEPSIAAAEPDGVNINDGCGSTHLDGARRAVCARAAPTSASPSTATPTGCSRSTPTAPMVDGDQIIALLRARPAGAQAGWPATRSWSPSMSNLGFHRAMSDARHRDGRDRRRRPLRARRDAEHAAVLGGEQSGHVIALDRQTTGDGLITAVLLLDALGRHHEPLAEAATIVRRSRRC